LSNRNSLTSSEDEKSVLVFYNSKYFVYTVPNERYVTKLFKANASYRKMYKVELNGWITKKLKSSYGSKSDVSFFVSRKYSNVFIGGFGDELIWTKGRQNTVFDKTLYYFYNTQYFSCDIHEIASFDKDIYNPYIETGSLLKTVDYNLIHDENLKLILEMNGFKNKPLESLDNPVGLEITIIPNRNVKMLFPLKKVKYKYVDHIKAAYKSGGSLYKGSYMYFRPISSTSYYGFIQYRKYFSKSSLFSSISGLDNDVVLSKKDFNSIFNSYSKDIGNSTLRYFSDTKYTYSFEIIPSLLEGGSTELFPISSLEDDVLLNADVSPVFPGGQAKLYDYINTNIKYPPLAKQKGIQGKVIVRFVINEVGEVTNVKIAKSVNSYLDVEALRVVRNMPRWTPGENGGKKVKVALTLPIGFTLM